LKVYNPFIKSVLDRCAAIVLVFILMPLFVLVSLVLLISLREFPLFFQERGGYKNTVFRVIKFKTMRSNDTFELDHERMTKTSKFIRSISVDELPQLFNIIIGDMSFVGPRPLLAEYLHLYSETEKHRHDVRPGITGLAQINGRNSLNWKDKFALDLQYVENVNFFLDLSILLKTFIKVLLSESVNNGDNITMEKYNGHN
jgi:lipopolysaccharide/colanic/teichoic acid biosynthesis glycosyltransferase